MARMLRRYAQAPANVPGNSATTLDALASIGLRPANSSAGKVMSVPPPASEFNAPPANAARKRMRVVMDVAGRTLLLPRTAGCMRLSPMRGLLAPSQFGDACGRMGKMEIGKADRQFGESYR